MPPGMLRGPKAAAARSARCTWVCVDMHTECASPETHLKANVSRRLRRAVANCEQPTEQPTHWAITDPCTRPRTWPRSAITRRTPRLRLVMRRSGVRFPKAALRAFAPGLPQQPPTCVRQPRQVRCRPSPQGSCEPAVALTFKYRANQSLQLDTLRQRSPQGTNTVVPPRLDGAPRVWRSSDLSLHIRRWVPKKPTRPCWCVQLLRSMGPGWAISRVRSSKSAGGKGVFQGAKRSRLRVGEGPYVLEDGGDAAG